MSFQVQVYRNLSDTGFKCHFLFNAVRFLRINHQEKPFSFYFIQDTKVLALIHFVIEDGKAISLLQSPFGGFEFDEILTQSDLRVFVEESLMLLKARGVKQVELRLPPTCYHEVIASSQLQVLKDCGFEISGSEINCHIDVNEVTTFWSKLHSSEKNKLNKAVKQGFQAGELTIEAFDEVYNLVVENRVAKGFPVTMQRDSLHRLVQQLPEYHLFGVYDGDRLIACTVSIEVNEFVLYNFYMADALTYRSFSPLVLLNELIYNWCLERKIKKLDLGTVTVNGELNEGLYQFKKHLGAKECAKMRLEYIF